MVAARRALTFGKRHPSELPSPQDERARQQASRRLEIGEQRSDRLIYFRAVPAVILFHAFVRVPRFFQMSATAI